MGRVCFFLTLKMGLKKRKVENHNQEVLHGIGLIKFYVVHGMIKRAKKLVWGMCCEQHDETFDVDHKIKTKGSNTHDQWQRPQTPDLQSVLPEQILPCNIIESWDATSSRKTTNLMIRCHVDNYVTIFVFTKFETNKMQFLAFMHKSFIY